jgi:hypothetical protein
VIGKNWQQQYKNAPALLTRDVNHKMMGKQPS